MWPFCWYLLSISYISGVFRWWQPMAFSRLRYLEDREAAPGTDPKEGLPMDDWVTWHLKKVPGGNYRPWNKSHLRMVVGRWISFWDGLFAGANCEFQGTSPYPTKQESRKIIDSSWCRLGKGYGTVPWRVTSMRCVCMTEKTHGFSLVSRRHIISRSSLQITPPKNTEKAKNQSHGPTAEPSTLPKTNIATENRPSQ